MRCGCAPSDTAGGSSSGSLIQGVTRQDTPLTMRYEHHDRQARYKLRVVYVGFATGPKCKLVANGAVEIHPYLARPTPIRALDFDVPAEATRDGSLTLKWSLSPGAQVSPHRSTSPK